MTVNFNSLSAPYYQASRSEETGVETLLEKAKKDPALKEELRRHVVSELPMALALEKCRDLRRKTATPAEVTELDSRSRTLSKATHRGQSRRRPE